LHGSSPFDIAVLHGGPGAAGEVFDPAENLCAKHGVLEPFQTKMTVQGQVAELGALLGASERSPVVLVGYSWGAMLGLIFASRNPSLVRKLVLVSSGAFEDLYASRIGPTRLGRMTEEQRLSLGFLSRALEEPGTPAKDEIFAQLGEIISCVDSFDPLPHSETIEYSYDIFKSVWGEAEKMRSNKEFLDLARGIRCPVVAIHGDYDPHPAAGVEAPLSRAISDFRFVVLEDCGHKPWIERRARGPFFEILCKEVG